MLLTHMSNFVLIGCYLLYVPLTLYFTNAIAKFYSHKKKKNKKKSHIKNVAIRYFLFQTIYFAKTPKKIYFKSLGSQPSNIHANWRLTECPELNG